MEFSQITILTFSTFYFILCKTYIYHSLLKGGLFMKIEKISDTQIRCTLDKKDLAERELRLSELAYGSEKAKALFRDLMIQATYECGFDAEDTPLMIEAIPVNADCLVLVITKVEEPDELDTRFSNFTPFLEKDGDSSEGGFKPALADEILNCFSRLGEMLKPAAEQALEHLTQNEEKTAETVAEVAPAELTRVYMFHHLKSLTALATITAPFYHGENTLYRDTTHGIYYLVLHMSEHSPEQFNKLCNIASEYGTQIDTAPGSLSYYKEHYQIVLEQNALSVLATL